MIQQTLFADSLVNVAVQNGLVRLEWGTLGKPEKEGQPPPVEFAHRMVIPLDGFVGAMRLQQRLLEALTARAQQQPAAAPATSPSEA